MNRSFLGDDAPLIALAAGFGVPHLDVHVLYEYGLPRRIDAQHFTHLTLGLAADDLHLVTALDVEITVFFGCVCFHNLIL